MTIHRDLCRRLTAAWRALIAPPPSPAPRYQIEACPETLGWALRLIAVEAAVLQRAPHSAAARQIGEARHTMLLELGGGGLEAEPPAPAVPIGDELAAVRRAGLLYGRLQ